MWEAEEKEHKWGKEREKEKEKKRGKEGERDKQVEAVSKRIKKKLKRISVSEI